MWARFVLDLVAMLAREWRPRGFVLVLAELAYTITDPPVKAVRKIVPPLRAGGIQIDFSWSIVLIATRSSTKRAHITTTKILSAT